MNYKNLQLVIITFIFTTLISCNKTKIEYSQSNHLTFLNLNGKVKEVNISVYEHEIIKDGYIPKRKIAHVFMAGGVEANHLGLIFGGIKGGIYRENVNFFTPYNIGLKRIFYSKIAGTDYEIFFNKKGFITKYKGYSNDTLILNDEYYYDKHNRLIRFVQNIDFTRAKTMFTYKYTYDDNNLIKSKEIFFKDKLQEQYNYKYKRENDIIKATEIISGQEIKQKTYTIELNKQNQISYIKNISDGTEIKFNNNEITNFKENFKDGKVSTNNEFNYNNSLINEMTLTMRVRNSKNYNHANYKFKYNTQGDLKELDYNGKKSDIVIDYEYGNLNWEKLSYCKDRKSYDYYYLKKTQFEEEIKSNKMRYDFHKILEKSIKLNMDLNLIKELSSKIVIERRLKYY